METYETTVLVLICVSIISIIVLTIFAVKLLVDLSKLAKSATDVSDTLQNELEPTLKELREATSSLNAITGTAQEQVARVNGAFQKVANTASLLGEKVQGIASGFLKGIKFGLNLFGKK